MPPKGNLNATSMETGENYHARKTESHPCHQLCFPEGYVGANTLGFMGGIQRARGHSLGAPKNPTSVRWHLGYAKTLLCQLKKTTMTMFPVWLEKVTNGGRPNELVFETLVVCRG